MHVRRQAPLITVQVQLPLIESECLNSLIFVFELKIIQVCYQALLFLLANITIISRHTDTARYFRHNKMKRQLRPLHHKYSVHVIPVHPSRPTHQNHQRTPQLTLIFLFHFPLDFVILHAAPRLFNACLRNGHLMLALSFAGNHDFILAADYHTTDSEHTASSRTTTLRWSVSNWWCKAAVP
jgi:hypothetical protein